MHRKLRISEYEPLIGSLNTKFRSWAVKTLSFAGRLQLLGSVISGIVCFWISTFILPQGCIKKIESLCSRFLWRGNIDQSRGARVSWATVCLPKPEGGLGLRRFAAWNKTLSLRYVWLLFSEHTSLWADWHKHHHLQNDSFWSIKESTKFSWMWNSLLKLRPTAANFLKSIVGNGHNTSFWFDLWTPLGPIIKLLGNTGPRALRLPLNSSVADACTDQGWSLPAPRSDEALALHIHLTSIQIPRNDMFEDYYCWETDGNKASSFSSAKTWQVLRPRQEKKDWAKSVWFKGAVPKHAFNMWVVHLNRLPTRQRMASWGLGVSPNCCICSALEESRDHLFLSCLFASQIWSMVFSRLDRRQGVFCSWSELLSWTRTQSQDAPAILRKVVTQAVVFHIWKQRNNVLHNQHSISPESIFKCLDRDIRNIISSRRHKRQFRRLMTLWLR
ncbi:Reverse transcriptase zinc-binding domain [Arabidopsis suecica]|uniref:Reverse transcriptase zinc-binding domain n=1 Tax=Arabidopsis suecica TaxID=45249 RepID=A0A8T2APA7_ARASU|nr:Reverse transcriptase zinc-binding domain [Arabidopsis suecica]